MNEDVFMLSENLAALLTCLNTAAKVVEAIDDPVMQRHYGWDLSCWRYVLIPWGVRFSYQDPHGHKQSEIVFLALFRDPEMPRSLQRGGELPIARWNPYAEAAPRPRRCF
jgi:hypothetical protein